MRHISRRLHTLTLGVIYCNIITLPRFGNSYGHHLLTPYALGVPHSQRSLIAIAPRLSCHSLLCICDNTVSPSVRASSPASNPISPRAFVVEIVIWYYPRIVMLRKHQRAPRLIYLGLRCSVVIIKQISHRSKFFRYGDDILRVSYLLGYTLKHLTTPHQSRAYILLREVIVVLTLFYAEHLEILSPGYILRLIACSLTITNPRPILPACILKTHSHWVSNSRLATSLHIIVVVSPRRGLPNGVLL